MTTEILSIDELIDSQGDKFITHNRGLRQLEGQSTRVLSRTVSDPTLLSPALGDTYIVPTGAVAPWDTHANEIAHWYDPDGGSSPDWQYYVPVEGAQLVWVNDEDRLVVWDGTEWRVSASLDVDEAVTVTSVAGTVTLDLDVSDHFIVPLTENVTNIVVSNAPAAAEPFDFFIEWIQTGAFTVTWPSSFRWSNSTSPTITVTVGNADIHYHVSRDNANNIWSCIFTENTSQDALQLVGISQYANVHNRFDDDYNQVGTAYQINLGWRTGTTVAFTGGGDGSRNARQFDSSNGWQCVVTPGRYDGKYYLELEILNQTGTDAHGIGWYLIPGYRNPSSNYGWPGRSSNLSSFGVGWWDNGDLWLNGVNTGPVGGGWTTGDIVMLAVDLTTRTAYFGKNGTWVVGDPNTETGGVVWNAFTGLLNADEMTFCAVGNQGSGTGTEFRVPRLTSYQRPINFQAMYDRNQLFYTPPPTGPKNNLCSGMIFQDVCFDPNVSNPTEYTQVAFSREWQLQASASPPLGVCQLQTPAGSHSLQTGSDYTGPAIITIPNGSGKFYWVLENIPGPGLMEIGLVDLAYPILTTKPSAYLGTAAVLDPTTGQTYLNGVLQGAVVPVSTGIDGVVIMAYDSNTGLLWSKSIPVAGDAPWDLAGNPDTGAGPVWNLGAPVPMQVVVWLGTGGATLARCGGLYILRGAGSDDPGPSLTNAQSFRPLAALAY